MFREKEVLKQESFWLGLVNFALGFIFIFQDGPISRIVSILLWLNFLANMIIASRKGYKVS